MNPQDQLLDALERVLSWELPDEDLAAVVNDQVGLMAGDDPEETWQRHSDSPFSSQH